MLRHRVIPVLLLHKNGVVKTLKFKNPVYIGDPINAVRIFNDKEVDELILLDIDATREKRDPRYSHLKEIISEAFMPIGYGGGVQNLPQIENLFNLGIEKVILNSATFHQPELLKEAVNIFGSQSLVASIDVKTDWLGNFRVFSNCGTIKEEIGLFEHLRRLTELGIGEIFLNSIERDGTMSGYDYTLIHKVSSSIDVPLVASGGAGTLNDFVDAIESGASAVAAGAMFVFFGVHRAVLINYPKYSELERLMDERISK